MSTRAAGRNGMNGSAGSAESERDGLGPRMRITGMCKNERWSLLRAPEGLGEAGVCLLLQVSLF